MWISWLWPDRFLQMIAETIAFAPLTAAEAQATLMWVGRIGSVEDGGVSTA